MSNVRKFTLKAAYARRIPDPNFHKEYRAKPERHVFFVRADSLEKGFPTDANAREANTNKKIYDTVKESLGYFDGKFHLKNGGITIIAEQIKQVDDNTYELTIKAGQGIVNGGHTYEIITNADYKPLSEPLENDEGKVYPQYVKVEVLAGLEHTWIPEISRGLNTSVQVDEGSLLNLAGELQWLKDALGNDAQKIRWKQNEDMVSDYDSVDVLMLLSFFNIKLFPPSLGENPNSLYGQKKALISQRYPKYKAEFESAAPLVRDVLKLTDMISSQSSAIWTSKGGKGGALGFIKEMKGKKDFHFGGKAGEGGKKYSVDKGVLYPMLAAFRCYVVENPHTGKLKWRKNFNEVELAWKDIAYELLQTSYNNFVNIAGRSPDKLAKDPEHWKSQYQKVLIQSNSNTEAEKELEKAKAEIEKLKAEAKARGAA